MLKEMELFSMEHRRLRRFLWMFANILWMELKFNTDSFQWYPVTGQETMSTDCNTGNSVRMFLLFCSWSDTRIRCPERLWRICHRRYPKASMVQLFIIIRRKNYYDLSTNILFNFFFGSPQIFEYEIIYCSISRNTHISSKKPR